MSIDNKRLVIDFYNALARRDFDALRRLGHQDYIQHNPDFETGLDGLIRTLQARTFPSVTKPLEFVRVIAEGDLVMTLRRMPPPPGQGNLPGAEVANIDIFRVEDGLVAEHWDYREQFPRGGGVPRNSNGRF